ncbi:Putative Fork head domain, Zinc finger, PHD-type, Zinc finger, FYVE/PHD-type [Septoria linicola]|uniref:Fork head domain, Zinc finger, PHD-type, Zinc finger, FYVE/PHD-type n=1 Tax=Septoria linicola TaxID=215465 RepID=A0A9Q9EQ90_9PEZI|nr:Putative Fork head domain, Zinc finger, PHD-type, Zinc finger, FYVE/PHD-type [Septoria linicola]
MSTALERLQERRNQGDLPRAVGHNREELFPAKKKHEPDVPRTSGYAPQTATNRRSDGSHSSPAMRHSFQREVTRSSPDHVAPRSDSFAGIPPRGTGGFRNGYSSPEIPIAPSRFAGNAPHRPGGLHRNLSWSKPTAMDTNLRDGKRVISPHGPELPLAISTEPSNPISATSTRTEPHIFLPAANLPKDPKTIRHLKGFYRSYNFEAVLMDSFGYYITFLDTSEGRQRLVNCALRTKQALLFKRYSLIPRVFYDKKEIFDVQRLNAAVAAERSRSSSPGISILGRAAKLDNGTHPPDHDVPSGSTMQSFAPRPLSLSPQESPRPGFKQTSRVPQGIRSAIAEVGTIPTATAPPVMTAPPIRQSPRQPTDDSSSVVSGTTASSRSKATKCRVCKGLGGAMSTCQTCSRQYHKHCRPLKSTAETTDMHWQCQSCVEKGIPSLRKVPVSDMSVTAAGRVIAHEGSVIQEKALIETATSVIIRSESAPHSTSNDIAREAAEVCTADARAETIRVPQTTSKRKSALMLGNSEIADETMNDSQRPTKIARTASVSTGSGSGTRSELGGNHTSTSQSTSLRMTDTPKLPASDSSANMASTAGPTSTADNLHLGRRSSGNSEQSMLSAAQDSVEQSFTATTETITVNATESKKFTFKRVKRQDMASSTALADLTRQEDCEDPVEQQVPSQHLSPRRTVTDSFNGPEHSHTKLPQNHLGMLNHQTCLAAIDSTTTNSLSIAFVDDSAQQQFSAPASEVASPADSVIQPAAPKPRGVAKARRSKLITMRCSRCGKHKVPYNPSGKADCIACKSKADGPALPREKATVQATTDCVASALNEDPSASTLQQSCTPQEGDREARPSPRDTKGIEPEAPRPPHHADIEHTVTTPLSALTGLEAREDGETLRGQGNADNHHVYQNPELAHSFLTQPDSAMDVPEEGDGSLSDIEQSPQAFGHDEPDDDSVDIHADLGVTSVMEKKREARKSQRVPAADQYDLGDSWQRPKSTYLRLIAMAMCAAHDYRATPRWVVEWIDNNIPNYQLGQGIWANGVQATMSMNASGKNGEIMITSQPLDPEDTRKGSKVIYELLPGMADQLEHWDTTLQRPRLPAPIETLSSEGPPARSGFKIKIGSKKPAPVGKLPVLKLRANSAAIVNTEQAAAATEDAVRPTVIQRQAEGDAEVVNYVSEAVPAHRPREMSSASEESSEEDQPLASMQRKHVRHEMAAPDLTSPAHWNGTAFAHQQPAIPSATLAISPSPARNNDPSMSIVSAADQQTDDDRFLEDDEETDLLNMIRADNLKRKLSSRSLFIDRPHFDPRNKLVQQAKVTEVVARRQKQIAERDELRRQKKPYSKRAGYSVPGLPRDWGRCAALPSHPAVIVKDTSRSAPRVATDGLPLEEFDILEEFLGVPDDLVPAIMNRELVYRHIGGKSRTVYRAGI